MAKLSRFSLLVLLAAAIPSTAHAASISIGAASSNSFDVYWSLLVKGTELSAVGKFDVTVTNEYADFTVKLTNNTAASANEEIHAIALNSDPNGTQLSMLDAGNYFQSLGLDRKFAGYQTVDICAWT